MTTERPDWLIVERRHAPLIVSIPHAGTELLGFEPALVDPWLARKDTDWRLDALYDFVAPLGATVVRTRLSRSIIDVNRDPSGASLIPARRRQNSSRRPRSTASRFIGPAERQTRLKSSSDGVFISLPTTWRSSPRLLACARSTSASRCSTPTPFGQSSRASSRASCRFSISARIQASAAALNCARQLAPCSPQANFHRRWALQRRLDHARLWAPERRRRGFAARTRLPRLHAGARAPNARQLGHADR
jgi:N-formylglutamate amidohydrolase